MNDLVQAILKDDPARVERLLKTKPQLATSRFEREQLFEEFSHWIYAGDSPLHLAAAAHRPRIAKILLVTGADANAAQSRRRAAPLHYACDGHPALPSYDDKLQVKTIQILLAAGAAIDRQEQNGASPLHRAVRTRCAAAVAYLLKAGSNPTSKNKGGSTPFHLAVQNTGRGGTGSAQALAAQRSIIRSFLEAGISPALPDGKGKSVIAAARSQWMREML